MSSYEERIARKAKKPTNRKQRRANMQPAERSKLTVGARIRRRLQRRRDIEGADWLKQMRRQQRNQPGVIKGSPELKTRIAMKNELDLDDEAKRYALLPTPEQLEADRDEYRKRSGDQRASRR